MITAAERALLDGLAASLGLDGRRARSIVRSDRYRLERPVAGRESHPLKIRAFLTAHRSGKAGVDGRFALRMGGFVDRVPTVGPVRSIGNAKGQAWRERGRSGLHRTECSGRISRRPTLMGDPA